MGFAVKVSLDMFLFVLDVNYHVPNNPVESLKGGR